MRLFDTATLPAFPFLTGAVIRNSSLRGVRAAGVDLPHAQVTDLPGARPPLAGATRPCPPIGADR